MALQRWYPMTETRRTDGAVDRMWRGFNGWGYIFGAPAQRAVALDIVDEGETVVVKASLPGISPEDIQVTIEDDVLTLKGEASEEREDRGRALPAAGAQVRRFPIGPSDYPTPSTPRMPRRPTRTAS